jgi:Putative DNA-binding domain
MVVGEGGAGLPEGFANSAKYCNSIYNRRMSLFDSPIPSLTPADIEALAQTGTAESRILDYKRDAIGASDKERQEFLADVASFANAAGGHLVLGVEERAGVPVSIPGISVTDADAEVLRLEQIIRTGIRPVPQGVETGVVRFGDDRLVVVLRVPRSWTAPHQVGPVGSYRIFGRGSNGKYQFDVDELRTLFARGPDVAERLRMFRAERVLRIVAGEGPVRLDASGAKLVLHIVPLAQFATRSAVDLSPVGQSVVCWTRHCEGAGRCVSTLMDG